MNEEKEGKIRNFIVKNIYSNFSAKKLFFVFYIFAVAIEIITIISENAGEFFSGKIPIWGAIIYLLIAFPQAFLDNIQLFVIAFVFDLATEKVRKKSLTKIDFENTKDLYRDILKEYSPLELAYIDDFKTNFNRDVAATLLSLQLKGKIQIEDNKIVVKDSDTNGLKDSEIFILTRIENGKVVFDKFESMKNIAEYEAIKDELITRQKNHKKGNLLKYIGILYFTFIVFFIIIWGISESELLDESIMLPIIVIIMIFFTVGIPGIFIYNLVLMAKTGTIIKRTEKGEELNIKIEGLKNYISQYSLLNQKDKEQLEIWDEYLIYSVIFNQNKKIINDMFKLLIFK